MTVVTAAARLVSVSRPSPDFAFYSKAATTSTCFGQSLSLVEAPFSSEACNSDGQSWWRGQIEVKNEVANFTPTISPFVCQSVVVVVVVPGYFLRPLPSLLPPASLTFPLSTYTLHSALPSRLARAPCSLSLQCLR